VGEKEKGGKTMFIRFFRFIRVPLTLSQMISLKAVLLPDDSN
jgi:hypothetical protein